MDKAMEQVNRTLSINVYLQDIKNKLQELQNFSRQSIESSRAANDMNYRINQIKTYVTVSHLCRRIKLFCQSFFLSDIFRNVFSYLVHYWYLFNHSHFIYRDNI